VIFKTYSIMTVCITGNTSDVEMVYLDHGIVDAVEANGELLHDFAS